MPAIALRLHKDFIANSDIISENNRIVEYFQKIFKLNGWSQLFCGDFNKEFVGFNNALHNVGENNDFINFMIDIPVLKQEGTIKWKRFFEILASLTVITHFINNFDKETKARTPQILTIKTVIHKDTSIGYIHGEFSKIFRQWMSSSHNYGSMGGYTTTTITDAEKAMKTAYCRMFHVKQVEKPEQFKVFIATNGDLFVDSSLIMGLPGYFCGIGSYDNSLKGRIVRKFSSHNCNTPMKQLALLAGLAALHDKVRREMAKNG